LRRRSDGRGAQLQSHLHPVELQCRTDERRLCWIELVVSTRKESSGCALERVLRGLAQTFDNVVSRFRQRIALHQLKQLCQRVSPGWIAAMAIDRERWQAVLAALSKRCLVGDGHIAKLRQRLVLRAGQRCGKPQIRLERMGYSDGVKAASALGED